MDLVIKCSCTINGVGDNSSEPLEKPEFKHNEYKCPHNIIGRADDGYVRCKSCGEEIYFET
jgi:hypothetical protein